MGRYIKLRHLHKYDKRQHRGFSAAYRENGQRLIIGKYKSIRRGDRIRSPRCCNLIIKTATISQAFSQKNAEIIKYALICVCSLIKNVIYYFCEKF